MVAGLTGLLYFVGESYLEGKYGRLAILDTQLHFTVAEITRNSFLPLLYPGAFLMLLAAVFHLARSDHRIAWSQPFRPVPTFQVVAVVYVTWTAKLLIDFEHPAANVHWLGYSRRNVLFAVFALLVIGGLLFANLPRRKPRRLSRQTASYVGLLGIAVTTVGTDAWLDHAWPSPINSAALTVAAGLLAYRVIKDVRTPKKENTQSEPKGILSGLTTGSRLYLFLVVGICFALSAGLYGTVSAQQVLRGCDSFKAVEFDPTPAPLLSNHTYWLILHDDGHFFVRDMTAPSNRTIMVADRPDLVASVRNAGHVC